MAAPRAAYVLAAALPPEADPADYLAWAMGVVATEPRADVDPAVVALHPLSDDERAWLLDRIDEIVLSIALEDN